MNDIIISDTEPNVVLTTTEPDIIVTDDYQTDYNLPVATPSTLGGVKIGNNINVTSDGVISVKTASASDAGVIKVGTGLTISDGVLNATGTSITIDNTLSSTSVNPVQNKVITSNLNTLAGSITSLQGTVSNQGTTIGNHTTAIGTLTTGLGAAQDDIDDLEDTVTSQGLTISSNTYDIGVNTNAIATNAGNITSLTTRMGTAEGNITALQPLNTDIATSVAYSDIANYWTGGSIRIIGKGKIAFIYFDLQGSLTINTGAYEDLYQISDVNLMPNYDAESVLITDAGVVRAVAYSNGVLRIYNMSSSNITITNLNGNIPIKL